MNFLTAVESILDEVKLWSNDKEATARESDVYFMSTTFFTCFTSV